MKTPPPAALVLGGIVSVQVGAALAKQLFGPLGPAGTVTLRLAAAALILLAVARPAVRRLTRAQLVPTVAFAVALAAMNLTFYLSIERIPLGIAVTVEFVGPLTLAVLGSRRAVELVWAALAGVAVVVLAAGGGPGGAGSLDRVGLALALAAGGLWAGYIVLSKRLGQVLPGVTGLALACALATVLIAPVGIAQAGSALLRPDLLLLGAGVGLLSSAIPYGLEMTALRRMRAATFGVLMSLEPAIASLAGAGLLGERLSPVQWAAVGAACVASAGASRGGEQPPVDG